MELKDLIGKHKLSGVDYGTEEFTYLGSEETRNIILFTLDGTTYKAVEDPNDGYRSTLASIEKVKDRVVNKFSPQEVYAVVKPNGSYSNNDTIQFYDTKTNKIVLEIGTDNHDDYYPMCVMNWNPENLAVNQGKEK